ncbi:condensation domain-containing protein [Pectobacterium actinidiae]|uniref:condensation domain-containing protein n=1 Tax=Pectobacterium actinidiae TaxID=1507808 RepID=UPI0032EF2154
MKFINMPSLTLPPGRLTVWRTEAPPMSDARWVRDRRRASCIQEASIMGALEEQREGRASASWLSCTFTLPEPLDQAAFTKALCHWTDRHETLRSHLRLSATPTAHTQLERLTLETAAIKVDASFIGHFSNTGDLVHQLEQLFNDSVSPLNWPGYLFTTIQHATATTVCVAVDHTLIDGYSLFELPAEFSLLYHAAISADNTPLTLLPAASYLDFAEAERSASEALTADHEGIIRWQRFVNKSGGHLPPFPIPLDRPENPLIAQHSGHIMVMNKNDANAFSRICRAASGDTFSGLLACLAKSVHDKIGQCEFRTMIPCQTQSGNRKPSMGWYVGMSPFACRIDGSSPFSSALAHAVTGLKGIKTLAQIPITRVAELINQPLRDPFMISYMDMRRTPGSRHWSEWQVATAYCTSVDPEEVCLWFIRTHDGLFLNYRHPASEQASHVISQYLAQTRKRLDSVVSTGCWLDEGKQ